MNELQKLVDQVQSEFDDVRVQLDDTAADSIFAEFYRDQYKVFAEWRRGFGVGLSGGNDFLFGEGPHEIYKSASDAANRIKELLSAKRATQSPEEVALDRLRIVRRMSQQEIAKRLRITQASVSKIERQSDMYLSTLGKLVHAMGGKLELRAKFPDSEFRITQLGDLAPTIGRSARPQRTHPRRTTRTLKHK
ncbi:MAG: XRE family transcriptional regulator [Vicinamibacterales bacterium]